MKLKKTMMREVINYIIFFWILLLNINCTAQQQKVFYSVNEEVDVKPVFQGGVDSLQTFIYTNFEWTSVDFSDSGYIVTEFVLDSIGGISNIRITRGLDEFLDKEMIRIITIMPKWEPAIKNNTPINSTVSLAVYFKLDNY